MVVMGRMADLHGRRYVLYIGMAVFGTSSLFAGCASSINGLIFWRLIQGISCAILYPVSGAIVSNLFPAQQKGRAMGLFFGLSFAGLAIGPVLGGFIVGAVGWKWIFWMNLPVILISFLICAKSVPESRNSTMSREMDYSGMLLLIASISSLVLAMTEANTWGWLAPATLVLFAFSALLFILLYAVEIRARNPLIQFYFFTNRLFITSIIGTFFVAFFYTLAFFLMPLYLEKIRLQNEYQIGLMLLTTSLTVALVSPLSGKVVDKYGAQTPLLIGFVFFIASALLQANFSESSSLLAILIAFTLMGIGWGAIVGPSTVLAVNSVSASDEAIAMGTSMTLHNMGGAFGLSLGLVVFQSQEQVHQSFIAGYQGAMWLLVISSAGALCVIGWNFFRKKSPGPVIERTC
jgi:EmrB/QacA subfamily drug resistance transporter